MPKECCNNAWEKNTIFFIGKLDEDGTGNYFETSKSKTDTPIHFILANAAGCYGRPLYFKAGKINRIHFRFTPTNAETFTLRLWRNALAADYASNATLLWESDAGRVSGEDYDITERDIPFVLATPGKVWFSIEWTGAPGNTPGILEISGKVIH